MSSKKNMKKGFTLLELLIVMAVLAILASILLVVVKPQQIFAKARDTQRKSDLRNLSTAIEVYLTEAGNTVNLTADTTVNNGRCVGSAEAYLYYSSGSGATTPVPAGFTNIAALAGSTASNGTGWLPVNFSSIGTLNLSILPVDPTNTANNANPSYYYTYACRTNNTYELNAHFEYSGNDADSKNDGGNANGASGTGLLYEVGTDKTILPAATSANFYIN